MNSNIKIMLELQSFRDKAAAARADLELCEQKVVSEHAKVKDADNKYEQSLAGLKQHEKILKEKEFMLAEADEKLGKLEKKRELIKTEREQQASNAEIGLVQKEIGALEDDILTMMDTLNEEQALLKERQEEAERQREETKQNTKILEEKIAVRKNEESLNNENYNKHLAELDGAYRQRFDKLIKSKKGRVVGEVKGDVCSACNFMIPTHLAAEASRDENVAVCTNCGAYIYKLQET